MRRDVELDRPVDPVTVDDAVLREQIGELVDASHRRYAEILRAVDIFDRRGLCEGDGFRTTRAWLVGALGMSGPAAARLVKAARLLRELPELSRAVSSGRVSPEHVQQVATLASRVDTTRLVEIDTTLAEAALVLDVARFALVCQRAAAHLAPDGADPGAEFDRRAVTLSPAGTMTALRGQLDPEGAAALHTALDALMTPPGAGDERTAPQRSADALVELARLHLAAGDLPTVGGQRPQVGVLLYPQALSPRALATLAHLQRDRAAAARLGELAATDPDAAPMKPDPADMFGRTAEAMRADLEQPDVTQPESSQLETGRLESSQPNADTDQQDSAGTVDSATSPAVWQPSWNRPGWADPPWLQGVGPIPPEVAQRIACDADIWRVVLDPANGMPLDVGRSHRLVPYWIRKALYARDRGCRWYGCDAAAEWTDGHHLDPWADHGETRAERCILLCRHHHGLVHEGDWSIDLDPHTGEVTIHRPGGLPYQLPRGPTSSWNGPPRVPGDLPGGWPTR